MNFKTLFRTYLVNKNKWSFVYMYVEDYDIKAILLTSIDNVQLCPYTVIKYVIFFACLIFFIYKSLFNIFIFSYRPRGPPLFNLKCKVLD